jgi:hypothetical protein
MIKKAILTLTVLAFAFSPFASSASMDNPAPAVWEITICGINPVHEDGTPGETVCLDEPILVSSTTVEPEIPALPDALDLCSSGILCYDGVSDGSNGYKHLVTLSEHRWAGGKGIAYYGPTNCYNTNYGARAMPSGWNDRVSSVYTYYGCWTEVYQHENYGGASYLCRPNCPDLAGTGMNDQTSSFILW